jgi:hypothetical protein
MNEEFYALERNKTWHLVYWESASNIVYSKWVNELKKHDYGTIDKYKARLISQGFKQIYIVYYKETSSIVIKVATIMIIFSIVVTKCYFKKIVCMVF